MILNRIDYFHEYHELVILQNRFLAGIWQESINQLKSEINNLHGAALEVWPDLRGFIDEHKAAMIALLTKPINEREKKIMKFFQEEIPDETDTEFIAKVTNYCYKCGAMLEKEKILQSCPFCKTEKYMDNSFNPELSDQVMRKMGLKK